MTKPILEHRPPATERCDSDSSSPAKPAVHGQALLVRHLGWDRADAADTRSRLRPFEDDWDAPGMDAYDDL